MRGRRDGEWKRKDEEMSKRKGNTKNMGSEGTRDDETEVEEELK